MTPIQTQVAPTILIKPTVAANYEAEMSQTEFLQKGRALRLALGAKYKAGELSPNYEFREFPKALNLSCGERQVPWETETVKGAVLRGSDLREMVALMVVGDAEEEEATRAAYDLAHEMGVEIDPRWDAATLRQVVKQQSRRASGRVVQRPAGVDVEAAKAARIAALRAELADVTVAPPPGCNPLPATSSNRARRPHRRTGEAASAVAANDADPLDPAAAGVPDPDDAQIDALVAKGRAEYQDFDDRSAYVAALAGNLDELRQAIGGMPDGHRVVAALADDPDEAARILALRGHKLGAAIGRFAAKGAKPAAAEPPPQAPAPDPIHDEALPMRDWSGGEEQQRSPAPGGGMKAPPGNHDLYDPKISDEDFNKLRAAQAAARQARRRGGLAVPLAA